MNKKTVILTSLIIIISSVMLFLSGYYIRSLISQENNLSSSNTNDKEDNSKPTDFGINDSTLFQPNLYYFDDTVILITKDEPHYTLVATVSRTEKEGSTYAQNTRISFFDGSKWKRITRSDITKDSAILNNEFVEKWAIDYDKSRVLKQNVTGILNIKGTRVEFQTGTLENEITIRSLPGYTKFMSESDGKLTINDKTYDAYQLYTRIYSMDASELITYNGGLGLQTDWISFWDKDGNFYHIDSTRVDKPIPNYQPHSIGVYKSRDGSVSKTFSIVTRKDHNVPPQNYSVEMGLPINKSLQFNKYNDIDKSPSNLYSWHMGNIKSQEGVGLVEYISE